MPYAKLNTSAVAGLLLVMLAPFLGGCSQDSSAAPIATPPPAPGQVQLPPASMQMLDIETVSDTREAQWAWAPASIAFHAEHVSAVSAPVAARVLELHADVGARVKRGALLATLTSPEALTIRHDLSKAEVGYEVALAEARRQRLMVEKQVGTEVDLLAAEAALREASQERERARRTAALLGQGDHDRILLRAPRDGIVAARHATLGAAVEPNAEPLFMVGDPEALWVVAEVFAQDLAGLEIGAPALVELPALAAPVTGKVERIGAVLHTDTRRAEVFVSLDGETPPLRPGMLARVGFALPSPPGIVIPLSAVLIKDERRSVVYVHTGDTGFEARDVALGAPSHGTIAVLSGLQPGERVVVKGGLLLDGAASQLL